MKVPHLNTEQSSISHSLKSLTSLSLNQFILSIYYCSEIFFNSKSCREILKKSFIVHLPDFIFGTLGASCIIV